MSEGPERDRAVAGEGAGGGGEGALRTARVNYPKQVTCEDDHLRRIRWIGQRDRPVAVRIFMRADRARN
jgi:hypothetical protein